MAEKGNCKHEKCESAVRAKGYCDRHYRKWRKGLLAKPRHKICVEEGCRKPRTRRSLCVEHHAKKFKKAPEATAATA